jgi:hypothetical protein
MVEHSAHHHTVNVEEKYGNSHNEEFYGKWCQNVCRNCVPVWMELLNINYIIRQSPSLDGTNEYKY